MASFFFFVPFFPPFGGSLLGQKKHADAQPLLLSGYEGLVRREAQIPVSLRPLRLGERT